MTQPVRFKLLSITIGVSNGVLCSQILNLHCCCQLKLSFVNFSFKFSTDFGRGLTFWWHYTSHAYRRQKIFSLLIGDPQPSFHAAGVCHKKELADLNCGTPMSLLKWMKFLEGNRNVLKSTKNCHDAQWFKILHPFVHVYILDYIDTLKPISFFPLNRRLRFHCSYLQFLKETMRAISKHKNTVTKAMMATFGAIEYFKTIAKPLSGKNICF